MNALTKQHMIRTMRWRYFCWDEDTGMLVGGKATCMLDVADLIDEEWEGQRDMFLRDAIEKSRRGWVFRGKRFLIVRCK